MVVRHPGEHAGAEADAAVTATPDCHLAIRTADCAPVVLLGRASIGLVHAGWRGLLAGVVERTVDAMEALGETPSRAAIGPCIRPGCYEFDGPELDELVDRFGADVRRVTMWGSPALDLPGAVQVALRGAGVETIADPHGCTACDQRWFSHRARGEVERFATLAWLEEQ